MNQSVPILLYHRISEITSSDRDRKTVSPEQFEQQIALLHDQSFSILTVGELIACRHQKRYLPERPVVLTFDSGFADFATTAQPIMEKYGIRATLYVSTGDIGHNNTWSGKVGENEWPMMSEEQIRAAAAAGFEIGSQGHFHAELDTQSLAWVRTNIMLSKLILERLTGREVKTFAYPFGYHTKKIRELLSELGFKSACTFKNALSAVDEDPFTLSRISIDSGTTIKKFQRFVTGEGIPPAQPGPMVPIVLWRQYRRLVAPFRQSHIFLT